MTTPNEYVTGPVLRNRLVLKMRKADIYGDVSYSYADTGGKPVAWENFRREPEYWAQYIRVAAYHVSTGEPLEPLVALLRETSGCILVRTVTEHATLRPQVQAIFSRQLT